MATYNGEKYIKKQLDSILSQLGKDDELIISDDSSTDSTIKIITSLNDKRVKLYKNQKNKSPIFNFENAIQQANGDIIVLSDQDDIWYSNKMNIIIENMDKGTVSLKMYNGTCIDMDDNIIEHDLFKYIDVRYGLLQNIKKNSFIGCNIAFTRELKEIVLPFPADIPMHDMWIGSCAYLFGDVQFVNKKIFGYRLHGDNYTGKTTNSIQKIVWRYRLIKNLITRYINVKLRS